MAVTYSEYDDALLLLSDLIAHVGFISPGGEEIPGDMKIVSPYFSEKFSTKSFVVLNGKAAPLLQKRLKCSYNMSGILDIGLYL